MSKTIRNYICNSLIQLKVNGRNPDCCDLSMAWMNLLMAVRRREKLTLSGLAERRKVIIALSPNAEQVIEKMEKQEKNYEAENSRLGIAPNYPLPADPFRRRCRHEKIEGPEKTA